MFDPENVNDVADALNKLFKSDLKSIGQYNIEKIRDFDLNKIKYKMAEIYMKL